MFYAYPNATTSNTSYSRCELREQMVSGSDLTNWTFADGATMKGTLSMGDISKDNAGNYPKVIIMQIHGRLTNDQRDLIGADDNNAPPMLKIYWIDGKIKVKTKVLKNIEATYEEILNTSAWGDDDGYTFSEYVGFDKFTLEVKVSEGYMKIILNNSTSVIYDNIHIQKWGVFENYFKAGNYLNTLDEGSYAKVKYYELEISH